MNREIKFRAWDGARMRGVSKNDFFSIRNDGMTSSNIDLLLMQFTGLTDSRGVDIYEGDILCETFRAVVSFNNSQYIVSNNENKHVKGMLTEFLRIRIKGSEKCEVVGNVFDS